MAGWFDFVNGQTLPASRVQDYLMDQSVMVFADAAARSAALPSPTNGMMTYLSSPGELYVLENLAWVKVIDNSNLVSSLPRARNVLINGSFEINQRNFSSTTANGTYGFDRWFLRSNDTLATYSSQAFAVGDLEAAGAIARNYARIVTSGQTAANTLTILRQSVEGVRTLAGKTATYSFWAKAASGSPKITVSFTQFFGGGSANVETVAIPQTLSTSWARYSFTINVPSIAGKTIGSGGFDALVTSIFVSAGTDYPLVGFGIQSNTFDIWGVQLEEGSVATAFSRAATTLQGELAACERYFQVITGQTFSGANANVVYGALPFRTQMRTGPSAALSAPMVVTDSAADYTQSSANISISVSRSNSTGAQVLLGNFTGITTHRPYFSTILSSQIQLSAEL
jgi:hypothetical protein